MSAHTASAELEEILVSYRPRVAAFIAKMVRSDSDVDDLVQETLIRIARSWETFRGDSALSSWIFRIASNVCIDFFRARSARPEQHHEERNVAAPSSDGIVALMEKREIGDCVRDEMNNLPEAYRNILISHYMEGAPLKEIAKTLGTTENSAKVRLHRARNRFRDSCSAKCDVTGDSNGDIVCGSGKGGCG